MIVYIVCDIVPPEVRAVYATEQAAEDAIAADAAAHPSGLSNQWIEPRVVVGS